MAMLHGEALVRQMKDVKSTIYEYLFDISEELTDKKLTSEDIDSVVKSMANDFTNELMTMQIKLANMVAKRDYEEKMEAFEKSYNEFIEGVGA